VRFLYLVPPFPFLVHHKLITVFTSPTGTEGINWEHWDPDTKTLSLQFLFAQHK